MLLFADPGNPSCRFFEGLGGERLRDANGKVSYGNYGWRDLQALASQCPIDDALRVRSPGEPETSA